MAIYKNSFLYYLELTKPLTKRYFKVIFFVFLYTNFMLLWLCNSNQIKTLIFEFEKIKCYESLASSQYPSHKPNETYGFTRGGNHGQYLKGQVNAIVDKRSQFKSRSNQESNSGSFSRQPKILLKLTIKSFYWIWESRV